jgi:predicted PurR-regulated permease PerM
MRDAPERIVYVRPRTILVVIGIVLVVLALLTFFYLAWHVITWILIALFLALALNPAVEFFQGRGLGRGLASAVVFVLALGGITGLGFLVIPPLAAQISDFIEALPDLIEDLIAGRGALGFLQDDYQLVDRVREAIDERGAGGVVGLGAPALAIAQSVVTAIVGIVAIAFLTFFMLLEGRNWVTRFLDAVPARARARWERILGAVYRSIGGWVTGALVVALVAAVTTTIVLLATGVPYAFALGLLVAILNPIPLAGATLAAVVISIVAFLGAGIVPGIIVVVFFVVYQQVENHVLYPLVYGRTVRLSPLTVLVGVLIGIELAGIIGAIVAIPIAGSIQAVIRELVEYARERGPPEAV